MLTVHFYIQNVTDIDRVFIILRLAKTKKKKEDGEGVTKKYSRLVDTTELEINGE